MPSGAASLRSAVDALGQVAAGAGLPPGRAREEGLLFAAAIAESAPGAALEWAQALDGTRPRLAPANDAFFDAASRGRKWRQSPTAVLSELAVRDCARATAYAKALTEVASAACSLGQPTMRVTGNASVAAAAQLAAVRGLLPVSAPPSGTRGSASPDPAGRHTGPAPSAAEGEAALEEVAATGEEAGPGEEPPAARSVEEQLADLDAMVGLHRVKREVHQQVAMLTVEQRRRAAGLRNPDVTRHLVFVGNPGTGKTTVARLVAGIYTALGLLSKGHLVEVDRSELVAGYLGQTAIKTAEVCASAAGGVLFVDEAYSLVGDQYGTEAVSTLVKEMEDRRDDLVVIVAGYPEPMLAFIAGNPGLGSRFRTTIDFADYTDDEIVAILGRLADAADYDVSPAAEAAFRRVLAATPRTPAFGNGRFARNLLEEAIGRHAWRLRDVPDPTAQQLRTLLAEDFQPDPATAVGAPA